MTTSPGRFGNSFGAASSRRPPVANVAPPRQPADSIAPDLSTAPSPDAAEPVAELLDTTAGSPTHDQPEAEHSDVAVGASGPVSAATTPHTTEADSGTSAPESSEPAANGGDKRGRKPRKPAGAPKQKVPLGKPLVVVRDGIAATLGDDVVIINLDDATEMPDPVDLIGQLRILKDARDDELRATTITALTELIAEKAMSE